MFGHNAKYFNVLCGPCTELCIEHWTNRADHELAGKHSMVPSNSRRVTDTAMNEFSMDHDPSSQRTSRTTHQMQMEVILEEEKSSELKSEPQTNTNKRKRGLSSLTSMYNDFLLEDTVDEDASNNSANFDFGVYLEYWRRDRRNYVIPRHRTLKDEITKNRHSTITEQQFINLKLKCERYLSIYPTANDIGIGNEICGISPGSPITIEHLVALKLYSDFTDLQREFKRHCRRVRHGESVESVIEKNSEIAHWCRLLRESIMFWGSTMAKKEIFYCGLTAHLVLRSLNQRFECPLSTTCNKNVAERFTDEYSGVILKIKRANARTRYFDMTSISCHSHEEERLFYGSTIKIIGILEYNEKSQKWVKWESLKPPKFVGALAMFEQIYNGYFVDANAETCSQLLTLLRLANQGADSKSMFISRQ